VASGPSAWQVLQQQGCCIGPIVQEGAKHLRGCWAHTALLLGLPIRPGATALPPWWWSVRCGSLEQAREGKKHSHACGAMEQRLCPFWALSSGCVSIDRRREDKGSAADLLQLDLRSGEPQPFLAQSSREAGAAGVELDAVRTHPTVRGARARPEGQLPAPPPGPRGKRPRARDPLEAQGLTRAHTVLSLRGGVFPTAGLHAPAGSGWDARWCRAISPLPRPT